MQLSATIGERMTIRQSPIARHQQFENHLFLTRVYPSTIESLGFNRSATQFIVGKAAEEMLFYVPAGFMGGVD